MTYTDEELVRELEWRYPECELVEQACERLQELIKEADSNYWRNRFEYFGEEE